MCGIVGILSEHIERGAARAALDEAMGSISHRGPDDAGAQEHGAVFFGHRRLSIIDLAQGAQPMWSHDRDLLITFNGEIFNYLELRKELEAAGSTFRTSSDTEVILESFRQWGWQGFSRFNGQFAFALFDSRSHKLYLARDMMGEKPLYLSLREKHLFFGSTLASIDGLLRCAGVPAQLDKEALGYYLALNYVPFEYTLRKEIRALEPGTVMEIECTGEGLLHHVVHRLERPHAPLPVSSPEAASEHFEHLLSQAVALRMRSDVPVGLFLSGGIDSTLIATTLVRGGYSPRAFIARFAEAGFSEHENAEQVCRALGLSPVPVTIDPAVEALPDLIEELVRHGDEPLADSSSLPVYLLSRTTAAQVKVVLSGEGGDELFGGYLTYRATLLARGMPRVAATLLSQLKFLAPLIPRGARKVGLREMAERFFRNLDLPAGAAHFAWNGMWRQAEKTRMLAPDLRGEVGGESFIALARSLEVSLDRPEIRELLFADQRCYLVSDILAKTDRMSMAHGLEVRPALMDPHIVAFARALPDRMLATPFRTKVIPKKLLARIAPWYPRAVRKQGFSIPVHLWYRTRLKDFMSDLLHSRHTEECGIFNREELLRAWQAHQRGARDLGFELWGIMILLLWLRRFKLTA